MPGTTISQQRPLLTLVGDGLAPPDAAGFTRVASVLKRNEGVLRGLCQRWSLCHEDAEDVFQRVAEIFLRHISHVPPGLEMRWLVVVLRREAGHVRNARLRAASELGRADAVLAYTPAREGILEDHVGAREDVRRAAEALARCTPDQAKAVAMRVEGHTSTEIAERFGWTRTKSRRAVLEGTRRFKRAYAELESGDQCRHVERTLPAVASGSVSPADRFAVRSHLHNCPACRAVVRRRAEVGFPLVLDEGEGVA